MRSALVLTILFPLFVFAGNGGGTMASVADTSAAMTAQSKDFAYFIKNNGTWDQVALGNWTNGKWTMKLYNFSAQDRIPGIDALARALEESEATRNWAEVK